MTRLQEHIAELSVETWATTVQRVAAAAVKASQDSGIRPPDELVATAATPVDELIEHRRQHGPGTTRPTVRQKIAEADHLRTLAQQQAHNATQDKIDAETAAATAQAAATEYQHAAEQARQQARETRTAAAQRTRAAKEAAAQRETEWATERQQLTTTIETLRTELAQVRADAAAELATSRQHVTAAEARAQQRATERAEDRAAAESTVQELRAELAQVRADTTAEVAAARRTGRGRRGPRPAACCRTRRGARHGTGRTRASQRRSGPYPRRRRN